MSETVGGARPAAAPYAPPVTPTASGPVGPAAPPAEQSPLDVPRDTTPTWEVELLVSGAVLFGLLQLPSALHALADRWEPHVSIVGVFGLSIVNILLMAAVYGLIGCFVLHLAMRGYWVALVGVHSVFPGGVRWEKMKEYGPIQTQLNRERVRPLPGYIARVDNAASLVFASGFVLAATTLSSVAVMGVLLVPLLAAAVIGGPRALLWTLAALIGPLFLVLVSAQVIDIRAGARLDPDGRVARYVRAVLLPVQRLTPGGVRSLGAVMTTNVSKRVAVSAGVVGLTGSLGGALLTADDAGLPGAGNYRYFSESAPVASLVAARYGTLRGDAPADMRAPWLEADVVPGPYARLFIPYRPMVHNDALARACPGLPALDFDDHREPAARAAAREVLACAARVHRVTLDGRPVGPAQFRFLADPRTNLRGFAVYVPTAGLAPGEHVLVVWPAYNRRTAPPKYPHELPFWR